MKNFFIRILIWYKDDFASFNIALASLLMVIMIMSLKYVELPQSLSIIILFSAIGLIILANYFFEKISNRYIVKIPSEKDCDCDDFLLETKQKKVYPINGKAIFSPGGIIKKVKSTSPGRRGKWVTDQQELSYFLPMIIGEIIFEECREEIFIKFFMDAERKFNPMEIHSIYKENNLNIIDNCLYIEDALKISIIKLNEDNEKLKKGNLHLNENFFEYFKQNLLIPKFSGVKNYTIYTKKEYK